MSDNGGVMTANVSPHETNEPLVHLEQRVRRLEDAVAQLQDTRQLEERIVERIAARAPAATPAPPRESSSNFIADAGRRLLPAAAAAAGLMGSEALAAPQAAPGAPARRPWLIYELWTELRSMVYMHFDLRYRMTWYGRVIPVLLFAAILTSFMWFPGLAYLWAAVNQDVAGILMKLVDLVLAYFLFAVLRSEARRYRETVPIPPPRTSA